VTSKLIDKNGLQAKGIAYSDTQLWRLWKTGRFPKPVKLGAGRNAWVEAEIDSWIEGRIAARDSDEEGA
jgi:prophage regulatory protein